MTILAGVVVLTIILSHGLSALIAAPLSGEVTIVAPHLSEMRYPIPLLETSHSSDWMKMLYDPLVGTTPEGELSPTRGWPISGK